MPARRSTGCLLCYATASSRREAMRISDTLVREQLAACANILGPIRSVYRWKGRVENAAEVAILLKTTRGRFGALQQRFVELHAYDCPCLIALPVQDGHPEFLRWIEDSVRAPVRRKVSRGGSGS